MEHHFIGLDLETSGLDLERHAPIQLGLAYSYEMFRMNVGGWLWKGEASTDNLKRLDRYDWDLCAQKVHGMSQASLHGMPSAGTVDGLARRWVRARLPDVEPKQIIPVGWNVGSFDMPFVQRHFPWLGLELSYRTVDLNAIVLAIVDAGLTSADGTPWDYFRLKEHVKTNAYDRGRGLGFQGQDHDAGFDAVTSLLAFEELTSVLAWKEYAASD